MNKTKAAKNIRTHSLQEQAEKSEDGETFAVLTRIHNYRIGVGARVESSEEPTFLARSPVQTCCSTFASAIRGDWKAKVCIEPTDQVNITGSIPALYEVRALRLFGVQTIALVMLVFGVR